MSPELFATYSQMRGRELRRAAERERLAATVARGRWIAPFTAVQSWLDGRLVAARREVEPCPTC